VSVFNKNIFLDYVIGKTKFDVILGIETKNLSYQSLIKLIQFNALTYPWLKENISDINDKWFISIDKTKNSFRINFYDKQDEVYFILAWIEGAMKDYENED